MSCSKRCRQAMWVLLCACILLITSVGEGETSNSSTIGQKRPGPAEIYQLKNKFGTVVAVDIVGGTYNVEELAPGAAGPEIRDSAERSWFGRGIVSVLLNKKWYRSTTGLIGNSDGRLLLSDVKTGASSDRFGSYDFIELQWQVPDGTPITTSFHLYRDRPYLIFTQGFPAGFKNYASGDWTVPAVVFPQFISSTWGVPENLSSWTSGGMWTHRLSYGDAFTIQGTIEPLVVSDPTYRTLILSPFDHYLVATQQSRPMAVIDDIAKGTIDCGIEGLVNDIPSGFEHSTILVTGQGIHETMYDWGRALLEKGGKAVPSKYQDDTLKYLVYMDDAGAYYYEHGFKENGYKTYADIILGIEKEAKDHNLRIGSYHVLDDPQQRDRADGLFEPRNDLFPEGLAKFHDELGKPLELYMMWIKPNGPYRQKYGFFATDPGEIPGHMGDVFYSQKYWRDTAAKLASWGTVLLQHDFLSDYEGNQAMMSDVDRMDIYYKNMAKALQNRGIDMQYCMALPRNILQSTENPVMVSLQASEDHHVPMAEPNPQPGNPDNHDPYFWKQMIFTGALYGALGIWPSRDNIQTVADPNAFEDVMLANLLGGSIQLGHRLGEVNYDLLSKTYRQGDELILKADRPIQPLDRCYRNGCAVGYTQSRIGEHVWSYVLSLPSAGYTADFTPSDLGETKKSIVYNWDTHVAMVKDSESTVPLTMEAKHEYFVVAPILRNGMAVIGDTSKFVTMADKRIESIDDTDKLVTVSVIANDEYSPIISGYSGDRPESVTVGNAKLDELSSLERLKRASSGWIWDYQTKIWQVKIDFSGTPNMVTRPFSISSVTEAQH